MLNPLIYLLPTNLAVIDFKSRNIYFTSFSYLVFTRTIETWGSNIASILVAHISKTFDGV